MLLKSFEMPYSNLVGKLNIFFRTLCEKDIVQCLTAPYFGTLYWFLYLSYRKTPHRTEYETPS